MIKKLIKKIKCAKKPTNMLHTKTNYFFKLLINFFVENKSIKNFLNSSWYIILGEDNCGKNTMINNSGLSCITTENTQQNDTYQWYLTESAFFINTNLKTTEQNADITHWLALIKFLKKYRGRKTINGVILTVDLSSLVLQDITQKQNYIQAIQQYLSKLHQKLKLRIPVYLLFTKCDLIAGFIEFFNDLNQENRKQIWGITLPLDLPTDTKNIQNFLSNEYDQLIHRLNEHLLWRMANESNPKRRELIAYFPQQMQLLKKLIVDFATQTLAYGENPVDNRLHFRGIYFSSAKQIGTPRDFLIEGIEQKFSLTHTNLPQHITNTQSYFLQKLFHDVIFSESNIAGNKHHKEIRARRWLYLMTPTIALFCLIGLLAAYQQNKQAISQCLNQIHYYRKTLKQTLSNNSLTTPVKSLNIINDLPVIYQHVSHPWLLYCGFYTPMLISHTVDKTLYYLLQTKLMPRVKQRLVNLLQQDTNHPYFLYNDLKAYLAFNLTKQIAPHWIIPPIYRSLQSQLKSNPNTAEEIKVYLKLATRHQLPKTAIDHSLVANVRNILRSTSAAQRAFWNLKQFARFSKKTGINLQNKIGVTFTQTFADTNKATNIPALYAFKNFKYFYYKKSRQIARFIAKNDVIMGINNHLTTPLSALTHELQNIYVDNYLNFWQQLLAKLHLRPWQNIDQATRALKLLTLNNSPLRKLLMIINTNTRSLIYSRGNTATKLQIIDRLIQAEKNKFALLTLIDKNLNQLYIFLNQLNHTNNINLASFKILKTMVNSTSNNNPIKHLYNTATQLPQPLKNWLQDIANYSIAALSQNAFIYIKQLWQTNVLPTYEKIKNNYPLNRHTSAEIDLTTFAKLFGPEGLIDKFYQDNLKTLINPTTPWQWKKSFGNNFDPSNKILKSMETCDKIRNQYFINQQPQIIFHIKPIYLDPKATQVNLTLGKQNLLYAHDPQQSQTWQWSTNNHDTKIIFTDFNGRTLRKTYHGQWAWFKMLIDGKIHPTNIPNTYQFTMRLGQHIATFRLTTTTKLAALKLTWLKQLKLSSNTFGY